MLHIIKRTINILAVILIFSCKNERKDIKGNIENLRFSTPVNIDNFLTFNQKIDTIKLTPEKINKELNLNYESYNKYTARLDKSVTDYNCCSDYLVTGFDNNGNEYFVSFFTKYPNKGTEIWGEIFVRKDKKEIFDFLKTDIKTHKSGEFYSTNKDGCNILLHCNARDKVFRVFLLSSKNNLSVDEHHKLLELFYDENKLK